MRVNYESVLIEKEYLISTFPGEDRRPVDAVFERIARTRLYKEALAERFPKPSRPAIDFEKQFNLAVRQKGMIARKLYEDMLDSGEYDVVVGLG